MTTNFKRLSPARVQFLFVHCSATRPSQNFGVADIKRMHLQRGFFDVGYHYVIKRDGTVEKGRSNVTPGAHVEGYNGRSLGICMIGGVSEKDVKVAEDNFTPAQWTALRNLLEQLREEYPLARIAGHREVQPKKACPSFDVQAKLREWGIPNPAPK